MPKSDMIRFAFFKDHVAEVMHGVVRGKEAWCNTGSRDQLLSHQFVTKLQV